MKLKCYKSVYKPWKESCNICEELEYSCYV